MMRQRRFISPNRCTILGNVDNGDAMQVSGQMVYGKSLFLPLNFTVNLKLLLKIVFKKISLAIIVSLEIEKKKWGVLNTTCAKFRAEIISKKLYTFFLISKMFFVENLKNTQNQRKSLNTINLLYTYYGCIYVSVKIYIYKYTYIINVIDKCICYIFT